MHRHPFTNYPPVGGTAPGRAKYPEYKSLICAMGVFRSQTPRALWDASYIYHNLAFAFHFGRIRPLFLPVSGLIFYLWHQTDSLLFCLIYSGILARTYSRSPQYGVPTKYHSLARFISIRVFTHWSSTRTSRHSPQWNPVSIHKSDDNKPYLLL